MKKTILFSLLSFFIATAVFSQSAPRSKSDNVLVKGGTQAQWDAFNALPLRFQKYPPGTMPEVRGVIRTVTEFLTGSAPKK